ncbi:hypothetical protein AND_000771 [Anopheles darlingi]|uniref:C2 domain-containing protein n=1 Tax=Anopheles darlingi TaxID=43151 RepID=W5JST4_ANODA|nr:hypothetical protein AND_000771 [Anopheles darlingi]
MGDITLDKMIDAILASAKKELKLVTPRPKRTLSIKSKQSKGSSPTYTPADDPAMDLYVLEQQLPQRLERPQKKTMIILEENGQVNEHSASSALIDNQARGTLELNIRLDAHGRLLVHVIRCTDLQRTNLGSTLECTAINAYVKVTLAKSVTTSQAEQEFQRTAVHRNSNRPHFDQRFYLDVSPNDERRVQLTVWHRNRECKRSEFLGCMSFPVRNVIKKEIYGSYRLQSQACLVNPSAPISDIMCEISQSSVDEIVSMEDPTYFNNTAANFCLLWETGELGGTYSFYHYETIGSKR